MLFSKVPLLDRHPSFEEQVRKLICVLFAMTTLTTTNRLLKHLLNTRRVNALQMSNPLKDQF